VTKRATKWTRADSLQAGGHWFEPSTAHFANRLQLWTILPLVGPDFISLQVRDLDTAAAFYEDRVGLRRAPASPPGAVVFASEPIPFAVRDSLPDTDLDSGQPGLGIALWLRVDDAQGLHDQLAGRGDYLD
jgi:hypothetical protein